MAYMIPEKPREYDPKSKEGQMFHALENLPREYYVVHSLKMANVVNNALISREADFVVFHPDKGLLVLECKGGFPKYDGQWKFGNGEIMPHGGPYRQAETGMREIEKAIRNTNCGHLLNNCRMFYGVWFSSLSRDSLRQQNLPPEADLAITLTMEDLADPQPAIERIFSIDRRTGGIKAQQKLSKEDVNMLLTRFICPQFDLAPSILEKRADEKVIFHTLLNEQKKILDFLVDQPVAVINGAAGTGKTWVALEKARRHADDGEEVLFLCYNRQLKDFLEKRTTAKGYKNIHFFSIDGFACSVCNTTESDFPLLNKELQKMFMEDKFPYRHIIIDEGQDFGQDFIEENEIMPLLCDIVTADESKGGTFYVFYDRLQTIQGKRLPKFIEEADCRLTLTRNCRNTENIAKTSVAPVTQRKPKLFDLAIPGGVTKIAFCDGEETAIRAVDIAIAELEEQGEGITVILTCATAGTSILREHLQGGKYKGKYLFTTCRKFKGLEADNVVLIDVNEETFNPEDVMMYYVGTSRAKTGLRIIATLDDEACSKLLVSKFDYPEGKPIKSPQSKLADKLCAMRMRFS